MDLSCTENTANERYPFFLMPGQEVHETPEGDLSEDRQLHRTRHAIRTLQSIIGAM